GLSVWPCCGAEKAEVMARLVAADRSIPAGRVRREMALLLADQPAAARLGPGSSQPTAARGGNAMRVGIATDHGGFELKEDLMARLRSAGHQVTDFGAGVLD